MINYERVSVDFHGVINSNPTFFRQLLRRFKELKLKVYVVSGGPREYIEKYLAQYEIPYDELWCIFDYFNDKEKIEVATDGSFHIDDVLWDSAKGAFCARENIGLHIDDSMVYGRYFITPYVQFDTKTQCFVTGLQHLSVEDGVHSVANRLLVHN